MNSWRACVRVRSSSRVLSRMATRTQVWLLAGTRGGGRKCAGFGVCVGEGGGRGSRGGKRPETALRHPVNSLAHAPDSHIPGPPHHPPRPHQSLVIDAGRGAMWEPGARTALPRARTYQRVQVALHLCVCVYAYVCVGACVGVRASVRACVRASDLPMRCSALPTPSDGLLLVAASSNMIAGGCSRWWPAAEAE